MNPPIVTVRNARLSLWQSAAEEVARTKSVAAGEDASPTALSQHPLVQGAAAYVTAEARGVDPLAAAGSDAEAHTAALAKAHHEKAEAKLANDPDLLARTARRIEDLVQRLIHFRRFSDVDLGFTATEEVYMRYWLRSGGKKVYRDWKEAGKGDPNYGVIDYRFPPDARIAIIGDWGTGLDDARAMLREIFADHRPTAIIHLGDVYYSGTIEECADKFTRPFGELFQTTPPVPVFTIPGNHDYYAWGVGFFDMLGHLNTTDPSWQQQASYFCLRCADDRWQFLAMDTAQSDGDPLDARNPMSPTLRPSEQEWLLDKLAGFPGKTVLCSHHQVFSFRAAVNAPPGAPYLNAGLRDVFGDRLDRVPAWYWGHEHSLALYQNGLFGVAKGRLIGASAFEATRVDDPYKVVHPEVAQQPVGGQPVQVGMVDDFYNHSYAIIDMARKDPADPVSASYYQFPSWGGSEPKALAAGQPKLLATEALG